MKELNEALEPVPPSPDDWRNMLELTPDQISNMYSEFPGFNGDASGLLIGAVEQVRQQRDMAQTDSLTKIGNRASVEAWEAQHYNPKDNSYIAIAFDLNDFKALNDTFGHGAGDQALLLFSLKLLHTFRFKPRGSSQLDKRSRYYSADSLFVRSGGDEFVVVLRISNDQDVDQIVTLLEGRMLEKLTIDSEEIADVFNSEERGRFNPITAKYGVAVSDEQISFAELLKEADLEVKKIAGSR